MGGGGPRYEQAELDASHFVLELRRERIDQVVARRTRTLTVVLDGLEDSFNMAAVLRTCDGMGIQEVHVIENPAAPFTPHAKVTQGCEKWLDVHLHPTFAACRDHLRSRGFALWASAVTEQAQSLYTLRFDSRMALVFGNERHGVSPEVLAEADGVFWLPMRGFTQSLNVSAATAATLGRAVQWREEHLGPAGDLTEQEASELRRRFQILSVKQRQRIYKGRVPDLP